MAKQILKIQERSIFLKFPTYYAQIGRFTDLFYIILCSTQLNILKKSKQ